MPCVPPPPPAHSSTYKKTFFDVSSFDDLWDYIEGPLYSGLYPDEWYNGQAYDCTCGVGLFDSVGRPRSGSLSFCVCSFGPQFCPKPGAQPSLILPPPQPYLALWDATVLV
jgi:hypothetical protein